jgi:hypothetical protein
MLGLLCGACGTVSWAQQTAHVGAPAGVPVPQAEMQRLGTSANALMNSMPSFTCDEAAVSEAVKHGKVGRTVKMAGVVRAVRQQDGELVEKYEYKHEHLLLVVPKMPPLFVSGGFATALGYFLPSVQACYVYTMSGGRIDFVSRPVGSAPHSCTERGLKGFALLDGAGNVRHIERTLPPEVANPLKLATFASVDMVPVEMDGVMYPLSDHIIAEMPLSGEMGRFEARYTNCHKFAATVTLGASSEVPAETAGKP